MHISFTDRELDVMSVLWAVGPATVAEVRERIADDLAYTTVLTILRTRVMPKIMGLALRTAAVQRIVFRTISQTGIRYRGSPLSEALASLPENGPRPGDRFPWLRLKFQPNGRLEDLYGKLDDTRFTLLVFGQAAPPRGIPELGDRLHIQELPSDPANDRELARARIPRPSFYLLRPDGHIGLAGARLDAAAASRYVSERLRFS